MSFLEPGKAVFDWAAAPAQKSVRKEPGCVQCGARLEMNGRGVFDGSGKCFNCANWVSDEEDVVDDLEG